MSKILVVGWDSAPPELVFEKFTDELPNVRELMSNGTYGSLESTIPAITCPAWMSMVTGKSPGKLALYGFRNRVDYSYNKMAIANSTHVREKTIWDLLSDIGMKSIIIGVPPTYPPKKINGYLITCFLTPGTESQYTYPTELKPEVEAVAEGYMLDVEEFRTEDKDTLLTEIYKMTEKRFKVAKHLIKTKGWDLFMMVEIGPDRIHHGFWSFFDRTHRKYRVSKYENAILDYYKRLDELTGDLMRSAGDDVIKMLVSDHGAKKMEGGICINEWLYKQGYLSLKDYPDEPTQFNQLEVDWDKTLAWGEGGYYGRVFLNVKGREPRGIVPPEDYERVREEISFGLQSIGDEAGNPIGTKVFKPEEIYSTVNGVPPDLIVYFGDLNWRSVGSIGLKSVHTFENDTGPDDANHSQCGIFVVNDPNSKGLGMVQGLHIMDVAPTILNLLNINVPNDMEGKVIYG